MLVWFVVFYLLISSGIGVYVATRVHNTKDFALAGRTLPLPIVIATVFATWFGAEAVFGVSATFVKEGLRGVVADPFGASFCLIIAGVFYGTKLYKMNLLTLGDFFRIRFSRSIEVLTTLCIIFSYLGWVSAQVKALGLVFSLITDGAVSEPVGTVLGAAIVLTYTTFGGMLSTAILDFLQMITIIAGLLFIAWIVSGMTGGVAATVAHAAAAGKLNFFPGADAVEWFSFLGAWMTMMLGSIPQQDVFQRVTSAKNAKTAILGSVLGGVIYFAFTFVPMFIAYSATLVDPEVFNGLIAHDSQLVLPTLVLNHMPVLAQSIFFGALLSAIMSTSSATLLAPSVAFSENIVRGLFPHLSDRALLRLMRTTTFGFTCGVLVFSLTSDASIFKMVENAYKVTLVGAFVPLFLGVFWSKSTTQGALVSVCGGVLSWVAIELLVGKDSLLPPQMIGFCVSLLGMVVGSLLPQKMGVPGRIGA
ncbi:MAG: sodium:solute symporter family protein [Candidatus Accumulibacter sp.]|jgi:Na+/proline symporter|nr:sodium:solute symporter family protein [Accumulibacter sp.]